MSEEISWGVVATVAEPAPLVQCFVAHHLHLGADAVHIYLDDPNDPTGDLLAQVPGCHVTRCDTDWWGSLGLHRRPPSHRRRQFLNATAANAATQTTYLLHCDADEFLRPGANLAQDLARLRSRDGWLKIPNLERGFVRGRPIDTIFDGVFKRYNPDASRALTNFNFTGHSAGKAMTRSRSGWNIGIHAPRKGRMRDREIVPHQVAQHTELLHFDGLSPLHWAAKMVRMAAQGPEHMGKLWGGFRIEQTEMVLAAIDNRARLHALYDDLNALSPEDVEQMVEEGHVVQDGFDTRPALAAIFPDQTVDISVAAFDAALAPKLEKWLHEARQYPVFQTAKRPGRFLPGLLKIFNRGL